jgi:hypothetical protein
MGIAHYPIHFTMRTFAPYDKTKQGSYEGKKKERKERLSDEWDVRIDCRADYADIIVENLKFAGNLKYCLVSGIEQPDSAAIHWGSKDLHVHICLISEFNLRRDQALALCRGPTARGPEYAVPRNKKYTYAGWYIHHTKMDQKVLKEPAIRYESGLLPLDPVEPEVKKQIQRLFKKFGSDDSASEARNQAKFGQWLE